MEKKRVKSIVGKYMFPTEGTSYMGGLENRPVIAKSEGRTVWDTNGKAYLDFQSGQMGAALGHQHPRMVKRITATMESLLHSSNTMLNVPRLRLHEKLGKILPRPLEKSVFLVSGSDSIEASIDLARKATGGLDIIGLHAGLHGSTSYVTRSVSFNWDRRKHAAVAPHTGSVLTPYCYRCPLGLKFPKCEIQCLTASLELADANFTAQPAGFISESVLSAGGIIVPPEGYLNRVKAECDKRGMELIMDEAQTGLGKTGKLFGFQHEPGLKPESSPFPNISAVACRSARSAPRRMWPSGRWVEGISRRAAMRQIRCSVRRVRRASISFSKRICRAKRRRSNAG